MPQLEVVYPFLNVIPVAGSGRYVGQGLRLVVGKDLLPPRSLLLRRVGPAFFREVQARGLGVADEVFAEAPGDRKSVV